MKNPQYSAESAPPMAERLRETIEKAGIPVRETGRQPDFPAQEQAAERSRAQMFSYNPKGEEGVAERSGPRMRVENVAREIRPQPGKSDPDGSWTGVPEDPMETPVQDADDL